MIDQEPQPLNDNQQFEATAQPPQTGGLNERYNWRQQAIDNASVTAPPPITT